MRDGFGFVDALVTGLPLWCSGLLLVTVSLLALAAGSAMRRRSMRRQTVPSGGEPNADAHIISAIFTMLAFISGITFSIAVDRYDGRRALVAEEAGAISDAYLRAGLFDDPDRARLHALLRQYAHTRVAPDGLWDQNMEDRLKGESALRDQLWEATHAAAYPVRTTELGALLIESMNKVLDVGTRRETAGRSHIPTVILAVLGLYLLASSAALGYVTGTGTRGRHLSAALVIVLFAIIIILIVDLDRPRAGSIRISQRALEDVVMSIDRDHGANSHR